MAFLFVLIYHAPIRNVFQGGFLGVDVFFVISGYVVTLSIQRRLNHDRFSFVSFYKRIILRLAPAYLVLIAFSLPICLAIFSLVHQKSTGTLAAFSSFFISNICAWRQSGYFDLESKLKALLHTWSLSVEWQFYFTWPLLLFASHKAELSLRTKIFSFSFVGIFLFVLQNSM